MARPAEDSLRRRAGHAAVVRGEPLRLLPEDVYIPPDALEVVLELFSGPLDVLLYLIKKQNLDILDIPIAQVARQYMDYIRLMAELRLELAAEYLLMAAWLAEIKSRMLLPRPSGAEAEEEDPRALLMLRLQEYALIKEAADRLDRLPRLERDVFMGGAEVLGMDARMARPEVGLQELLLALQDVLKRCGQNSHHQIVKEPLSVRERMSAILEHLKRADSLFFTQLFSRREGRHGVVVSFLAILELSKERLIDIFHAQPDGRLGVRAARADGG